jgi:hypothetical protein
VNRPVPSLHEVDAELPRELDRVFEHALAKDPNERYSSAAEFVADLRAALDDAAGRTELVEPAYVPTTSVLTRAAPLHRRRPWFLPVALAFAGAAIAGGVIGALLAGGDKTTAPPRATTITHTVTAQGTTATVEVTTPAAGGTVASSASGAALNNQGWALMQRGDYAGALPLLEQAIAKLDGTGSIDEAYTDYNLAYTRLQLGNCDGVLGLLDESQSIQGHRPEINRARAAARKACR